MNLGRDEIRYGPVVRLGILVEADSDWRGDGINGDVVAVDKKGGFA